MLEIPRAEGKTQNRVNTLFYPEQISIASVLSKTGGALAVLEHRREKPHALKQGKMQKFLTGRILFV